MRLQTAKAIRDDEGKSLDVYEDTLGNLTVGIGHKVVRLDHLVMGDTITDKRCASFFMVDLKRAEKSALDIYTELGGLSGAAVLHVLTCMAFQMGGSGVRKFKKMLAALSVDDYDRAADEMLNSKWARQDTPARAQRLADVMRGTVS